MWKTPYGKLKERQRLERAMRNTIQDHITSDTGSYYMRVKDVTKNVDDLPERFDVRSEPLAQTNIESVANQAVQQNMPNQAIQQVPFVNGTGRKLGRKKKVYFDSENLQSSMIGAGLLKYHFS